MYAQDRNSELHQAYYERLEVTLRELFDESIELEYLFAVPLAERLSNSDISSSNSRQEEYTFFDDNTFYYTRRRSDVYANGNWKLRANGEIVLQWETRPIRDRKKVTGGQYMPEPDKVDFERYDLTGPSKLSDFVLSARRSMLKPRIYQVGASSSLADNRGYLYQPAQAFDGDPETAWNEDSAGDGSDQVLWIEFDRGIPIDQLVIMAGYFDPQYFHLNNRVKRMTIRIFNSGNSMHEYSVSPPDNMTRYDFRIPKRIVSRIEFHIDEVYKGTEWNDLAISEISFSYQRKEIEFQQPD